jgi:hypothetical protein
MPRHVLGTPARSRMVCGDLHSGLCKRLRVVDTRRVGGKSPKTKTATAHSLCEAIHRSLRSVTCEHSPGLTSQKLSDREQEFSVTLGPEARDFFASVNGLRMEWRYETEELVANNTYVEGRTRLLDFHQMMQGFDGRFWRDELAFEKRLKVLDYVSGDSSRYVCLEIVDDVITSTLWLHQQTRPPLRLEITLDRYLDALRETKGIWDWQFLYADVDLSRHEWSAIRTGCEELVTWYPRIFEDGVETHLRERLRQRLR